MVRLCPVGPFTVSRWSADTLLIYCLIERQVRLALAPDTEMIGFYNDGRAMPPHA